jgi:hypothetical protein
MGNRKIAAVAAAIILGTAAPASANIVFDFGTYWGASGEEFAGLWAYFGASPGAYADKFTLEPGATTFNGVNWWGAYRHEPVPDVDDFTIQVYADMPIDDDDPNCCVFGGSTPQPSPLYEFQVDDPHRIDLGIRVDGEFWHGEFCPDEGCDWPAFSYQWTLPEPITLQPDTRYWLSIGNSAGDWGWSSGNPDGFPAARDGDLWDIYGAPVAFQLTNEPIRVPEPASVALFLAGLLSLGWLNRRKTG